MSEAMIRQIEQHGATIGVLETKIEEAKRSRLAFEKQLDAERRTHESAKREMDWQQSTLAQHVAERERLEAEVARVKKTNGSLGKEIAEVRASVEEVMSKARAEKTRDVAAMADLGRRIAQRCREMDEEERGRCNGGEKEVERGGDMSSDMDVSKGDGLEVA